MGRTLFVLGRDLQAIRQYGRQGKDDDGVLELFETYVTDVEIKGVLFFPLVKEDSKGIRVNVLN
jgi:hypothetical protein